MSSLRMASLLAALAAVLSACGAGAAPVDGGASGDGEAAGIDAAAPGDIDAAAPAGKRMFVTGLTYSGNLLAAGGGADGVAGADNVCSNTAGAVGLTGTWRAWISTPDIDAIDRISGDGPWFRVDGEMAFLNHANLTTTPHVPLILDEVGATIAFPYLTVWTGTGLGGRWNPDTSTTCADWTSEFGDGTVGDAGELDGGWTDFDHLDCDLAGRLYCFEE